MADEKAIEIRSTEEIQNLEDYAMSPEKIIEQVAIIQNISKAVMKDGIHFGKIPGCGDKPTLLKPGAEKLIITFRLSPKYEVEINDMGNNHREYEITCNLESIVTGVFIGSGLGCCSTMESKYRYRTGEKETTEFDVPKKYWDNWKKDPEKAQQLLNDESGISGKLGIGKDDAGKWKIAVVGEKKEHDNPADYYNTVKKMAKKRALVDAVLSATGASDIFTQDIEDLNSNGVLGKTENTQKKQPEPQKKREKPNDAIWDKLESAFDNVGKDIYDKALSECGLDDIPYTIKDGQALLMAMDTLANA